MNFGLRITIPVAGFDPMFYIEEYGIINDGTVRVVPRNSLLLKFSSHRMTVENVADGMVFTTPLYSPYGRNRNGENLGNWITMDQTITKG